VELESKHEATFMIAGNVDISAQLSSSLCCRQCILCWQTNSLDSLDLKMYLFTGHSKH